MKVSLKTHTPNPEATCIEIARVSSSRSQTEKKQDIARLLKYLIRNKHWSPFEHASFTFEIETSRAIGTQLLRHRSFTFQELSQRYCETTEIEAVYFRQQADSNRQSSEEQLGFVSYANTIDLTGKNHLLFQKVQDHLLASRSLYKSLLAAGIAKECARMVLPLTTATTIFMTGNLRSWIHFLEVRDDEHAQLEVQLIARKIKASLSLLCPILARALGWVEEIKDCDCEACKCGDDDCERRP